MLRAPPELDSEVTDAHAHPNDSATTSAAWPDVFISHASEDKELVARPLAAALTERGWTVWLDELELTVGDSLSRRIDDALAKSRFGVVVLSPAFFAKEWPQRELAGLAAREVSAGAKIILPVWHNVDQTYIVARSPTLADRLGSDTKRGIDVVADELARALTVAQHTPLTTGSETLLRAPLEIARETQRTRPAHQTRWLVAGGAGLAIVGAVVGLQGDRGGSAIPALDQFASSTRLELAYPNGYRRVAANEVFPELTLNQAVAVEGPASKPGRQGIVIASGFTDANGTALLPRSFRRSINDKISSEPVRIGDYEALVYRDVDLKAGATRIYAIPTRDGVATTACTTPHGGAHSLCDAVVGSERFLESAAVGLGVDAAYDRALGGAMRELNRRRQPHRKRLAEATTSKSQAREAKSVENAYRSIERTLRSASPPPQIADVHAALIEALIASAAAYKRLYLAGRAANLPAFNKARVDIATRDRQVGAELAQFAQRGYGR